MRIPRSLVVTTRRLELRTFRLSDFARWRAALTACAPAQSAFDVGRPPANECTQKFFRTKLQKWRHYQRRDLGYMFGVFLKRDGALIGTIDITPLVRLYVQSANLGYVIYNTHWNQGFATEASQAAIRLAFTALQLHRIEAYTNPRNRASIRVARKLGMQAMGRLRKLHWETDRWADNMGFYITPEEIGVRALPPAIRPTLRDYL